MNGTAEAAVEMLAHAIKLLRESVVSDETIRDTVDRLLAADLTEHDDLMDVLGYTLDQRNRFRNRRWARIYVPIGEAVPA